MIHIAFTGLQGLEKDGAFRLFLADRLPQDGLDQGEVLKGLDLLPQGLDPWEGRWLAKYNDNHVPAGCPEGGRFCSAEGGTSGASPQVRPASRSVQVILNDGSVVVGTNGKPMLMPSTVSLENNVALGEKLKDLGPGLREREFKEMFSSGRQMDYQMQFSPDGKTYNRDYIDFGNYNYGAVSAAAGLSQTEMLMASGWYNQKGGGDKSAIYGNNPRNLAMIMQGYKDYTEGKIVPSRKDTEAQRWLMELN